MQRSENVIPGGECKKRKLYRLVGHLLNLQKQALWLESNLCVAHKPIQFPNCHTGDVGCFPNSVKGSGHFAWYFQSYQDVLLYFFPGKNVEIYLIHVDHIFKQMITLSFGMVADLYTRWTYICNYTRDGPIYLYMGWTYIREKIGRLIQQCQHWLEDHPSVLFEHYSWKWSWAAQFIIPWWYFL